jgi:hypothetical protein
MFDDSSSQIQFGQPVSRSCLSGSGGPGQFTLHEGELFEKKNRLPDLIQVQ